ncbi:hypothetical protein HETIRDRAFT_453344 [Heterobasidion irregulare TC 32-1]|uniref:Uncharacterized protein n=1 Tax=Heterobasidion irregulare (strain TC 32-1) TaxID=747525 RepID=W4JYX2_HETIT|nr:uncharacterized protein HETIRDRAFT_453344 [Heterobasidion irregulare TC 32-1]ETW78753.1 hypothetical protein HETIRDRAFT_453344 [Heterobasidion irregulare TC 32-1]
MEWGRGRGKERAGWRRGCADAVSEGGWGAVAECECECGGWRHGGREGHGEREHGATTKEDEKGEKKAGRPVRACVRACVRAFAVTAARRRGPERQSLAAPALGGTTGLTWTRRRRWCPESTGRIRKRARSGEAKSEMPAAIGWPLRSANSNHSVTGYIPLPSSDLPRPRPLPVALPSTIHVHSTLSTAHTLLYYLPARASPATRGRRPAPCFTAIPHMPQPPSHLSIAGACLVHPPT